LILKPFVCTLEISFGFAKVRVFAN
jgi:hypothetical protein